jgi:hypothetical protein
MPSLIDTITPLRREFGTWTSGEQAGTSQTGIWLQPDGLGTHQDLDEAARRILTLVGELKTTPWDTSGLHQMQTGDAPRRSLCVTQERSPGMNAEDDGIYLGAHQLSRGNGKNNNNTFTLSGASGVVIFTGQRRVAPLEHCALVELIPAGPLRPAL